MAITREDQAEQARQAYQAWEQAWHQAKRAG